MSKKLKVTTTLSEKECREYLIHGYIAQLTQSVSRSKISDDVQQLINLYLMIDKIKKTVNYQPILLYIYRCLYQLSKQIPIAIMGDKSVGKTQFIRQMVSNMGHWRLNTDTIEGGDKYFCSFKFKEKVYEFELIDTTHDTDPEDILSQHQHKLHAFIVMFSINDINSFKLAKYLRKKIDKCLSDHPENIIAFVANKCDLKFDAEDDDRLDIDKCREYTNEYGIPLIETSVKENKNIENVFEEIVVPFTKSWLEKFGPLIILLCICAICLIVIPASIAVYADSNDDENFEN